MQWETDGEAREECGLADTDLAEQEDLHDAVAHVREWFGWE